MNEIKIFMSQNWLDGVAWQFVFYIDTHHLYNITLSCIALSILSGTCLALNCRFESHR